MPDTSDPSAPSLDADELRVRRSDPVYNAHGYLTKVPLAAIVPLIERHCPPGGIVLDPFAGSGMTGVAAAIAGRRALLGDINELAGHVGRGLLNLVDETRLRDETQALVTRVRAELGELYTTRCRTCERTGEIAKLVWSCVYACSACGDDVVWFDLVDAEKTACPACDAPFVRRTARRTGEHPVLVHVDCERCGPNRAQAPAEFDLSRIEAARQRARHVDPPDLRIDASREMHGRSALRRHGLESTAAFFSPRNLVALTLLHRQIGAVADAPVREKLRLAFTAILARASKRYQWSRKRPLNAQNQTYYIAPVFYEWNVLDLFSRKVRALARSDAFITRAAGGRALPDVSYHIGSADSLDWIPDASVDYVFTDPPFGSNLFYSDMTLFHEAWLGRLTDRSNEAVVATGPRRGTSHERYERILARSLGECARVLKPGGCATLVFSSSRGEVWAALQRAIGASGLELDPDEVRILDKGQRSVKGLSAAREHVVTVDLVLGLRHAAGDRSPLRPATDADLAEATLRALDHATAPPSPSHLYLYVVRDFIRSGRDLSGVHLRSLGRARAALELHASAGRESTR